MKQRITLILYLLLLLPAVAAAQNYPVNAQMYLNPPYSLSLADYTTPGTQKMFMSFHYKRQNRPSLETELRFIIKNNNLKITTKKSFNPRSLILESGLIQQYNGSDLARYLKPENLNFQGYSKQKYRRTSQLPEGFYRICVEVISKRRGEKLSNTACATAWLELNRPPMLNSPGQNKKLNINQPQNLTFQWTPRHRGSPNAAFSTGYKFELYEIRPRGGNPENIVQSTRPIYTTTTPRTTLIYDATKPLLEAGRRYAWRVQAIPKGQARRLTLFENQGYSPVYSFKYGDACKKVTNVSARALKDGKSAKISWEGGFYHNRYEVAFRKKDGDNDNWFTRPAEEASLKLTQLSGETTYEYKVQGHCGARKSSHSPVKTFTTKAENPEAACGPPPDATEIKSTEPLKKLEKGDIIKAYDFDVEVVEARKSGSRYSGKGLIVVPFLSQGLIYATFEDIKLNENYRLTDGRIDVAGSQEGIPDNLMDQTLGPTVFSDKVFEKLNETTEQIDKAQNYTAKSDKNQALNVAAASLDEAVSSTDGRGSISESKVAPVKEEIEKAKKALDEGDQEKAQNHIQKARSKVETLKDEGSPIGKGGSGTVANSDTTLPEEVEPFTISFQKDDRQQYGLDAPGEKHDAVDYPQKQVLEENYNYGYKSLASGNQDYLKATWQGPDSLKQYVGYRTTTAGSVTKLAGEEKGSQRLSLVGQGDEQSGELQAFFKQKDDEGRLQEIKSGYWNLASYTPKDHEVVIVPVNGAVYDGTPYEFKQKLNDIYSQAVMNWDVTFDKNFTAGEDVFSPPLEAGSNTFSSYSEEMKALYKAYHREEGMDADKYYLFLVDQSSERSLQGYMPRKKRAGFIFTEGLSNEEVITTAAHELGHGAFRLKHIFDDKPVSQGSTDNLMDYSEGTHLHKYQWDLIHDPVSMVPFFNNDEENNYIAYPPGEIIKNLFNNDNSKRNKTKSNAKYKVTIRTFLPYNFVLDPRNNSITGHNMIDLANIRDYAQYNNVHKHGGFKTEQTIIFNFSKDKIIYNTDKNFKVPPTYVLNRNTEKSEKIINNESNDNYTNSFPKVEKLIDKEITHGINKGKNYMNFVAGISAGNPAVEPSPSIDYTLGIGVREDGKYKIHGVWDGFPAIEIFIEDLNTGDVELVYFNNTSDARQTNEPKNILNLFDGLNDVTIDISERFTGDYKENNKPYDDVDKMKNLFNLK